MFSLGPIILIAIAEAGLFFGQDAVTTQVMSLLKGMLGGTGAKADAGKRKPSRRRCSCNRPWDRRFTVRCHRRRRPIEGALNVVWEEQESKESGLWHFARNYVLSFAAVLWHLFFFSWFRSS